MTLRIHSLNEPILAFDDDHPAKMTLIALAECQRDCAGLEIAWPGKGNKPIDQIWHSVSDNRKRTFSGFIYEFVCFDLVLHGWINRPPTLAEDESGLIEYLTHMSTLLDECEIAAKDESNVQVLMKIDQVRILCNLWKTSFELRIFEDKINLAEMPDNNALDRSR